MTLTSCAYPFVSTGYRLDAGRFFLGAVSRKHQFHMNIRFVVMFVISDFCVSDVSYLLIGGFLPQVLCSTWKDDGMTVFSGGCDKTVKMWPLMTGGQPATVAAHDAPVKELAWIPQMNLLVTGSWDKTLK